MGGIIVSIPLIETIKDHENLIDNNDCISFTYFSICIDGTEVGIVKYEKQIAYGGIFRN